MSITPTATTPLSATPASAIQQRPVPSWVRDAGTPSSTASGPGGTQGSGAQGSGGTNPFDKLATDLQAALTALQSGNSDTPATSTTDTLSKLQGDLQSLISKFQSDGTGQASGAHHHHHAKPADQASGSATTTATADTAPSAASPTGEPAAQSFVADVLKAFKANFLGGGPGTAASASQGLGITA